MTVFEQPPVAIVFIVGGMAEFIGHGGKKVALLIIGKGSYTARWAGCLDHIAKTIVIQTGSQPVETGQADHLPRSL